MEPVADGDAEEKEVVVQEDDDSSSKSDDDEQALDSHLVYLGFVERPDDGSNDERVDSRDDSDGDDDAERESFVGGRPLWAVWDAEFFGHESFEQTTTCSVCAGPMPLLMQLYAPLDGMQHAYHRYLMVFCCTRAACWKARASAAAAASAHCVAVLRCQAPESQQLMRADEKEDKLCCVCGKPAGKACAKCHRARYCSRSHQGMDWKLGHRADCEKGEGSNAPRKGKDFQPQCLFTRMRIVSEPEVRDLKQEQKVMESKETSLVAVNAPQLRAKMLPANVKESELMAQAKKPDRVFLAFQARTENNPTQVLRYSFGAPGPLWVDSSSQMVGAPPPCEFCGSERVFEAQILPQLLYYLDVEKSEETAMDWASLVIYSCKGSCNPQNGSAYAKEFIFVH